MTTLSMGIAQNLAIEACRSCGANAAVAESLVAATLSAARYGPPMLGFPHFLDYLQSLIEGRINGDAEPIIGQTMPAVINSDAQGGIAQLGFDRAVGDLADRARTLGIAILTQRNSYTAGELGYYARRLAAEGLVSLVAANGPALMSPAAGVQRTYCTNPMAFGVPVAAGPLIIDQASSATAFVNIAKAAADGGSIPAGWAVDADGELTTDAGQALLGALLPFGGYKGANIALMVEILAAGLSGSAWSLDAGDFRSGGESPNAGMTIIAIAPAMIDPQFDIRLTTHVERLEGLGVRIPGRQRRPVDELEIDDLTYRTLLGYADRPR